MKPPTNLKSYSNLDLSPPWHITKHWHGDFGYSSDGIFFTWTTVTGESDIEVIDKAEKFLGVKFKTEQIKYR